MSDRGILNLVAKCYKEGKEKREEDTLRTNPFPPFTALGNPWKTYLDFYRGKHWEEGLIGKMATWKSRPEVNFCFRGVETYSTLLTDNRTIVALGPVEPGDNDKAEVIQAGVERWQELQDWDTKDLFVTRDSRIYGLGWYFLDGLDLKVVHPQHISVDPDATMHDYDPTWLVYEYQAQVGQLKKKYPDADWEHFSVKWTVYDPDDESGPFELDPPDAEAVNPALSTRVYQMWTKDDSKIVWDEEADRYIVKKSKKKYPGGRLITVAGGLVLEDRKNPFDHGEFPFTPLPAYTTTDKFYPTGDIENILSLQVMHNRMSQLLYDQTVQAGGMKGFCNPRFGLSAEELSNAPIQYHDVEDVQRAYREERPKPPSRHVFDFLAVLEKGINDILGLHDISFGAYTPGNKTAEEIVTLRESDLTRVRAAARLKGWAHTRVFRQLLHNLKQFGKETWVVSVAGDYQDLAEFDPKELLDDETLERDISITGGADAMLPTSYQELTVMAQNFYDRGIIDEEELLRRLNWPNYKEVAAKAPAKLAREQAEQAPPEQPTHQMPDGTVMPGETHEEAVAQGAVGGAPIPGAPTDGISDILPALIESLTATGLPIEQVLATMPPELQALVAGAV